MDEIKEQLDGYGRRLSEAVTLITRHDERIKDSKEAILENRRNIDRIFDKMEEIRLTVWSGVKWGIAIVAIPTTLVLYQLIQNTTK